MSNETTTIKVQEGDYKLVIAHFILSHRTISNSNLSFKRSLYTRAYIAELTCSIITVSLQSLITFKVIFIRIKAIVRNKEMRDMIRSINTYN